MFNPPGEGGGDSREAAGGWCGGKHVPHGVTPKPPKGGNGEREPKGE